MGTCSRCDGGLPPENDFVECSGCNSKFHYLCAGVRESTWRKYTSEVKHTWRCVSCKAKTADKEADTTLKSDTLVGIPTTDFYEHLERLIRRVVREENQKIIKHISGLTDHAVKALADAKVITENTVLLADKVENIQVAQSETVAKLDKFDKQCGCCDIVSDLREENEKLQQFIRLQTNDNVQALQQTVNPIFKEIRDGIAILQKSLSRTPEINSSDKGRQRKVDLKANKLSAEVKTCANNYQELLPTTEKNSSHLPGSPRDGITGQHPLKFMGGKKIQGETSVQVLSRQTGKLAEGYPTSSQISGHQRPVSTAPGNTDDYGIQCAAGKLQVDQGGVSDGVDDESPDTDFKVVTHKKRRARRATIIGSNTDGEKALGVPRRGHLHVYRLCAGTSVSDLREYLKQKAPHVEFDCELLKDNGESCSFRVSFPLERLGDVYDPAIWPSGVAVRRFIFPRKPTLDPQENFPLRPPIGMKIA